MPQGNPESLNNKKEPVIKFNHILNILGSLYPCFESKFCYHPQLSLKRDEIYKQEMHDYFSKHF